MNVGILRLLLAGLLLGVAGGAFFMACPQPCAPVGRFLSYRIDLRRQHLRLFWLDEHRRPLRSLGRLRHWLAGRGDTLQVAMNGGMFRPGNAPLGLYIENGRRITPLDTGAGAGNFYLRPNGVSTSPPITGPGCAARPILRGCCGGVPCATPPSRGRCWCWMGSCTRRSGPAPQTGRSATAWGCCPMGGCCWCCRGSW